MSRFQAPNSDDRLVGARLSVIDLILSLISSLYSDKMFERPTGRFQAAPDNAHIDTDSKYVSCQLRKYIGFTDP